VQSRFGAVREFETDQPVGGTDEASSGNKWTFPLAIGLSRTVILGGRPWKFGMQYWYYAASPDLFGPAQQIRFSVSPVVALPWGK
jgi:hypothetical protein